VLTQMERELLWLEQKLKRDEALVAKLEEFFREKRALWSKGVTEMFFNMLERKKAQLYYEQTRQEKLAWQIIMERDARQQ
jgi:hypothetical protein